MKIKIRKDKERTTEKIIISSRDGKGIPNLFEAYTQTGHQCSHLGCQKDRIKVVPGLEPGTSRVQRKCETNVITNYTIEPLRREKKHLTYDRYMNRLICY